MFNEFPGGVDQVLEHGVLHSLDDEALAGSIDVLTGDLEHTVLVAQTTQTLQLGGSVAGGHVGDGGDALFLQALKHIVQIVILELLRLFVAGDGVADIAQISIAQIGIDVTTQFYHILQFRTLVGGVDEDHGDKRTLQHAEYVILIEGILGIQQRSLLFVVEAHAQSGQLVDHTLTLAYLLDQLDGQSIH